jgi:hypothetical protein
MFNYKYKCDMTNWSFSEEKQRFVVTACEDIKKGEEVTSSVYESE